jgi:arylformamidase
MKFYDLTLPVSNKTPAWPGDTKFKREQRTTSAIVSKITISSHFGTHIDAPKHFIFEKAPVDQLPLAALIGVFKVFEIKPKTNLIQVSDIKNLNIKAGERILFKTKNSKIVTKSKFTDKYISISLLAAKFLAARKIRLIGVDYFGVEAKSAPGHPVHRALLSKGIVIVEGLNLSAVPKGIYQGAILPLKISGGDGAPSRAVLWK